MKAFETFTRALSLQRILYAWSLGAGEMKLRLALALDAG